ncbi:Colicin V production protein [Candidatus Izimaplasma bacterium HR1]|jgi:hypothetical protein|uniref:CvpA family protein n=1 Tax=Candidatus Izimoplasma sp. HR1 TaxID=1541959 RepID=UPI0004F6E407|nr:Colicin V production protein [Candidatus Izimaplasma bacterium HR1]
MLSSIIPEISIDFNFDLILIMIYLSYLIYGYFSGGHKQIRISINLILPFVIIYYMGSAITTYLYAPLSETFFFELINEYLGIFKNTVGMIFAYVFTYVLLFTGVFVLSIFARRYVLNENMRAKLGVKNKYIGALFGFINGYVLVYFIILPAFSLNLVDTNAYLTNFVLENPPPFSRIARTAEKAVPIKGLADKASNFEELLSVDGIEGYYNESIYEYQQQYVGGQDSYESNFMSEIYPELTIDAKRIIDDAYFAYFANDLSSSNYYGVSLVLIQDGTGDNLIYQDLLGSEADFQTEYTNAVNTKNEHTIAIAQYDTDLENFEYQVLYDAYVDDLEDYIDELETYTIAKLTALSTGNDFTETFDFTRPTFTLVEPIDFIYDDGINPLIPPTDPLESVLTSVTEAIAFVDEYEDKVNISSELNTLGTNFENHEGLLVWYVDVLAEGQSFDPGLSDISSVIVSFKDNYEVISESINDKELEDKLYLAAMSIRSYDVFTIWLEHTQGNIDSVSLDELYLEENRCPAFDVSEVTDYNFTDDALGIVTTLFEGESVSWIIMEFKYDYEAGLFDEAFTNYPEVTDVLESTKELVDEYDDKYKDIANSIEGNISMLFKIGISVMKYHLDVYETLENTPLIAAFFNDAARFCASPDPVSGYDIEICTKSEGETGMFKEVMNMRYLISEIYFKAYFMVDEDNESKAYDSEMMYEYLDSVNQSVKDSVISKEVVTAMADQFAFNIIDESNGLTLLEQMYEDGNISIEAMRVLADDEYELFSEDFRARVRSLIR